MVADFTAPDWQRRVARRALNALSRGEIDDPDGDVVAMRAELTGVRDDLGGYIDRLHVRMAPWGVSAYDCLQVLTDLTSGPAGPRTRVRFDVETLTRIAEDGAARARELIQAADRLGMIRETGTKNAWHRVVLSSPSDVEPALTSVRETSSGVLPKVRSDIEQATRETGLTRANTLAEWDDQLRMLEGVRASLDVFVPEIFEASAADMVIATATKRWREDHSIHMKAGQRRRLIKQARDYVRPGRTVDDLHAELIRIQEQRQIWRQYSPGGGYPVMPEGLDEMSENARRLREDLLTLDKLLGPAYDGLVEWDFARIGRELGALAADDDAIKVLPERVETIHDIHALGLDGLIEDLRSRGVPRENAVAELDLAWWASALSQILHSDSRLEGFDGARLESLVTSLRELDRAHVESLATQSLRIFREQSAQRLARRADEAQQLRQAIESGSVAGLLRAIGASSLGRALVPLQIVPPALASQLAGAATRVDLVVFDGVEGAPLGELAVPLGRASQVVVVVGDSRRGGDGLPALAAELLPRLSLPVASARINGVVASFLAEHGYGSDIVPIAQPSQPASIDYVLVDGRGMPAPGVNAVESTAAEVAKVVDHVIAHALERPEDTLAVIACNDRHAQRLSEAVLSAVADSPAIDSFFRTDGDEPFLVTSLRRCSGITRDRIIVSTGYGKTPHGRVVHDFGDLAGENGAAHLVDALLSTRGELTIVTALDPDEVELRRVPTEGTRLLHDLLERAKHHPKDPSLLQIAETLDEEDAAPDRLLVDLAERLYSLGLTVVPNVGPEGGLRIPLAIGHPDLPDELLVAVMTDNDAYVSERSMRRRDRHWADRLREYGWVTHMVFSTAVFMDPQGEAQRILEKVLDIVERRTRPVTPVPEVPEHISDSEFGLDQTVADAPRPGRPHIARGLPLAAYSDDQLDDLLAWIRGDGVERDESEEVAELAAELGLTRRGSQIDAILRNVVRRG
ncbi:prevent-host-death family protein [Nanchangia anserum]|nr:prevent-host-death family protein [Nanchangia anserum]